MADDGKTAGTDSPQTLPQPSMMIPARRWIARLKGTDEEVYTKLILMEAGLVAKTAEAWRALLEEIKTRPAHKQ